MNQTIFITLILLFSSFLRFVNINIFGANFYIPFFLGLIFLIKSDFKVNSKLLYFFLFAVPALIFTFLNNSLNTLVYGCYEVVTLFVMFFSIDRLKFNKLNIKKIKFVVRIILLLYFIFALIQALAPPEFSLAITKLLSSSDSDVFRYVESNILSEHLRVSLNFGVSTTASGFIFLLMFFYYLLYQIESNKWDVLVLSIGFLIIVLTGTRHSIVIALILFLVAGYNTKVNKLYLLLIPISFISLISLKTGYYSIVQERFSMGFDANFSARFDIGLINYFNFISRDFPNLFFGNGPGKLYELGGANWSNFGFVSNGLLLFHLNYGILIYFFLWKSIKLKHYNIKSIVLFLCLLLIFISDNYSYFTHSTLFLLILNFNFLNFVSKKKYSTN